MQVEYTDPYERRKIRVELPDDTPPEELNHVLNVLEEDARRVMNAERKERYHCPYHIEAMDYEGNSLAYCLSPETVFIRRETMAEMEEFLAELTETQRRRLYMRADGMTLREISEQENANINAVRCSLLDAQRKYRKYLSRDTCKNSPGFLRTAGDVSPIYEKGGKDHV